MTALKKAWRSVLRHSGQNADSTGCFCLPFPIPLSVRRKSGAKPCGVEQTLRRRGYPHSDHQFQWAAENRAFDRRRPSEKIEATGLAERGLYTARALFTDSEDQEEDVRSPHFNGHILAAYTADTPLTEAGEDNISYFSGYDSSPVRRQ